MVNVAIIPARAGSKRIINKNRKRINGDSLVERTYKFARKIKFLDDIIVSTDDPIILKTFKKKKIQMLLYLRGQKNLLKVHQQI